MIQEGLRRRGTLFFHAISRTLLNISRILLDKINVGLEKKGIQEGFRRRGTLFFMLRTLLNIPRILVDKINVGREEITLLNISRILLDKISVGSEKKGIQEGLRRRGTLFFMLRTMLYISRILVDKINTLLNISRILLDKISVGREKKGIQEGLRRRDTLFLMLRTLLNISRILVDKINVGQNEMHFSDSKSFS
ncbi:hypothetical protein JTB14_004474 [Gonioctena quinquepunctata]|nr:hypothetical protein JTB14_004474 [Gonioctena quinquepunctata]